MVFWMVHAEAIKEVILLLSVHHFWFRGALSKIEETNPLRNFSKDLEINLALGCIYVQSLHPKNTYLIFDFLKPILHVHLDNPCVFL
jgi:hypothetical protein